MDTKKNRKERAVTSIARNDERLKKLVSILLDKLNFREEGMLVKMSYYELAEKIYPKAEIESKMRYLQAVCNEKYYYPSKTFSITNIDKIAKAAGYDSWLHFIENNYIIKKPEQINSVDIISCDTPCDVEFDDGQLNDVEQQCKENTVITIGWPDYRYLMLKYIGFCEFKVIKSVPEVYTSKDTITARWFEVETVVDENTGDEIKRIYAVIGDERELLKI